MVHATIRRFAVLAGVEATVGTEHQAIGAAGVFAPDGHLAVKSDFVDAVVGDVGEEDVRRLCSQRGLR